MRSSRAANLDEELLVVLITCQLASLWAGRSRGRRIRSAGVPGGGRAASFASAHHRGVGSGRRTPPVPEERSPFTRPPTPFLFFSFLFFFLFSFFFFSFFKFWQPDRPPGLGGPRSFSTQKGLGPAARACDPADSPNCGSSARVRPSLLPHHVTRVPAHRDMPPIWRQTQGHNGRRSWISDFNSNNLIYT